MQEALLYCLEEDGFLVQGASSADEAIELGRRQTFDLVISDVRMAGSTDGLGAIEILKTERPQLRCIVITGFADQEARKHAIQVLVDDYVEKPFTLPQLSTAVRRVLESQQERSGYRRLLSQLPRKLVAMAEAVIRDNAVRALETQRDRFYQGFFLAIRSNLINQGVALDIWDHLVQLEEAFESSQGTAAQVREGAARYRQLVDMLTAVMRPNAGPSLAAREPGWVDKVTFGVFFLRVRGGQVSAEQFRVAHSLWQSTEESRRATPELEGLYQSLWA